ncbi:MAG: hypothetical protein WBF42_12835 [Terracidiphilus sp.]
MLKEQIVRSLILTAVVFLPTVAISQDSGMPDPHDQTEQELYQVQRDYYAIPYGLQLSVLVEAVRSGKGRIDNLDATQQPMADAQSFKASVSDITNGKIADIQSQPLADFATIPAPGSNVVHLAVTHRPIPDTDDKSTTLQATWGPMETQPPAGLSSMTIGDLVGEMSAKTGQEFVQYVAYTVNLSYQGQSVHYKAIYLYSTFTSLSHQVLDFYLKGTRYSDNANAYRPARLLRSQWREVPAVHDWLMAHTTTDPHCPNGDDVCCIRGQCAVSLEFMNKQMSRPPMVSQPAAGGTAGVSFSPPGLGRDAASAAASRSGPLFD